MQRQNRTIVLTTGAGAIPGTGTMSLIDGKKGADSRGQDLHMLYISAVEDAASAEAEVADTRVTKEFLAKINQKNTK